MKDAILRWPVAQGDRRLEENKSMDSGGREQWRMAANADHEQTLSPPKQTMRSDDVDFQRGELEAGGHSIYFNHYDCPLT